jgi:hypothetical protein
MDPVRPASCIMHKCYKAVPPITTLTLNHNNVAWAGTAPDSDACDTLQAMVPSKGSHKRNRGALMVGQVQAEKGLVSNLLDRARDAGVEIRPYKGVRRKGGKGGAILCVTFATGCVSFRDESGPFSLWYCDIVKRYVWDYRETCINASSGCNVPCLSCPVESGSYRLPSICYILDTCGIIVRRASTCLRVVMSPVCLVQSKEGHIGFRPNVAFSATLPRLQHHRSCSLLCIRYIFCDTT